MSDDELMKIFETIGQTYPFVSAPTYDGPRCACGSPTEPDRARCQRCEAKRAARARRVGVPAGLAWARMDSPDLAARVVAPTAIDAVRANLTSPRVVLVGPAGAGKSSLAVAALHALMDDPTFEPRFAHAYKLGTARIQHAAGSGDAPYVERAQRAEWLLLDDLGAERATQNNAVQDVISDRHIEDLPTWVTTGFSPAEIAQKYGDGIARRVFERAVVIKLEARR